MSEEETRKTFRSPDRSNYPELAGYSETEIYDGKMGPGGLYLASIMSRSLANRAIILDIGCGKGTTSVFLSKKLNCKVFALDLWISATEINKNIIKNKVEQSVIPLNLDVTDKLPFAEQYFDAFFLMDSVHYFGNDKNFWTKISKYLKKGGKLCIGSPCFSSEFSDKAIQNLPNEYNDKTDLWPNEFSKYHSPPWWKELLESTHIYKNIISAEVNDGVIFWEDDVLDNLKRGGDVDTAITDAKQYRFRKEGYPYLTHFILEAEKA
ncbi:SAM-dependent methyltransferase [Candidatus Leptofilum sp.]|uniref:SAM-dependent methyltransferase n=1 Tax=Candidatus Leptofilum sp. TaxID=3241576 RepID=UPI003B5C0E22